MKGTIDRDGTVTITFNIQVEKLAAGGNLQWLPCIDCGELHRVGWHVISYTCDLCRGKQILYCGNCGNLVRAEWDVMSIGACPNCSSEGTDEK